MKILDGAQSVEMIEGNLKVIIESMSNPCWIGPEIPISVVYLFACQIYPNILQWLLWAQSGTVVGMKNDTDPTHAIKDLFAYYFMTW